MNDYDSSCASEQVFVTGSDTHPSTQTLSRVNPRPAPLQDWHRADIIAAIRKTGISLSALSRQHQLSSSTLANALDRKWPRGEQIIATHLNLSPQVIWPSRYPPQPHRAGDTGFLSA